MMRATRPVSDTVAEYEALEQFDRDQRYIDEHYEDLWRRNPNCWIAVHQGRFIIYATTIETLLTRLEDNGLAPENVARRFMSKEAGLIL